MTLQNKLQHLFPEAIHNRIKCKKQQKKQQKLTEAVLILICLMCLLIRITIKTVQQLYTTCSLVVVV